MVSVGIIFALLSHNTTRALEDLAPLKLYTDTTDTQKTPADRVVESCITARNDYDNSIIDRVPSYISYTWANTVLDNPSDPNDLYIDGKINITIGHNQNLGVNDTKFDIYLRSIALACGQDARYTKGNTYSRTIFNFKRPERGPADRFTDITIGSGFNDIDHKFGVLPNTDGIYNPGPPSNYNQTVSSLSNAYKLTISTQELLSKTPDPLAPGGNREINIHVCTQSDRPVELTEEDEIRNGFRWSSSVDCSVFVINITREDTPTSWTASGASLAKNDYNSSSYSSSTYTIPSSSSRYSFQHKIDLDNKSSLPSNFETLGSLTWRVQQVTTDIESSAPNPSVSSIDSLFSNINNITETTPNIQKLTLSGIISETPQPGTLAEAGDNGKDRYVCQRIIFTSGGQGNTVNTGNAVSRPVCVRITRTWSTRTISESQIGNSNDTDAFDSVSPKELNVDTDHEFAFRHTITTDSEHPIQVSYELVEEIIVLDPNDLEYENIIDLYGYVSSASGYMDISAKSPIEIIIDQSMYNYDYWLYSYGVMDQGYDIYICQRITYGPSSWSSNTNSWSYIDATSDSVCIKRVETGWWASSSSGVAVNGGTSATTQSIKSITRSDSLQFRHTLYVDTYGFSDGDYTPSINYKIQRYETDNDIYSNSYYHHGTQSGWYDIDSGTIEPTSKYVELTKSHTSDPRGFDSNATIVCERVYFSPVDAWSSDDYWGRSYYPACVRITADSPWNVSASSTSSVNGGAYTHSPKASPQYANPSPHDDTILFQHQLNFDGSYGDTAKLDSITIKTQIYTSASPTATIITSTVPDIPLTLALSQASSSHTYTTGSAINIPISILDYTQGGTICQSISYRPANNTQLTATTITTSTPTCVTIYDPTWTAIVSSGNMTDPNGVITANMLTTTVLNPKFITKSDPDFRLQFIAGRNINYRWGSGYTPTDISWTLRRIITEDGTSTILSTPDQWGIIGSGTSSVVSGTFFAEPYEEMTFSPANYNTGTLICEYLELSPGSRTATGVESSKVSKVICVRITADDKWTSTAKSQVSVNNSAFVQTASANPAFDEKFSFQHPISIAGYESGNPTTIEYKITTTINGTVQQGGSTGYEYINNAVPVITLSDGRAYSSISYNPGDIVCQSITYKPSAWNKLTDTTTASSCVTIPSTAGTGLDNLSTLSEIKTSRETTYSATRSVGNAMTLTKSDGDNFTFRHQAKFISSAPSHSAEVKFNYEILRHITDNGQQDIDWNGSNIQSRPGSKTVTIANSGSYDIVFPPVENTYQASDPSYSVGDLICERLSISYTTGSAPSRYMTSPVCVAITAENYWSVTGTSESQTDRESTWNSYDKLVMPSPDEKFAFRHTLKLVGGDVSFGQNIEYRIHQTINGADDGSAGDYSSPILFNSGESQVFPSTIRQSRSSEFKPGDTICQYISYRPASFDDVINNVGAKSNEVCITIVNPSWNIYNAGSSVKTRDEAPEYEGNRPQNSAVYVTRDTSEEFSFRHRANLYFYSQLNASAYTGATVSWAVQRAVTNNPNTAAVHYETVGGLQTTSPKTSSTSDIIYRDHELNSSSPEFTDSFNSDFLVCERLVIYVPHRSGSTIGTENIVTDPVCVRITDQNWTATARSESSVRGGGFSATDDNKFVNPPDDKFEFRHSITMNDKSSTVKPQIMYYAVHQYYEFLGDFELPNGTIYHGGTKFDALLPVIDKTSAGEWFSINNNNPISIRPGPTSSNAYEIMGVPLTNAKVCQYVRYTATQKDANNGDFTSTQPICVRINPLSTWEMTSSSKVGINGSTPSSSASRKVIAAGDKYQFAHTVQPNQSNSSFSEGYSTPILQWVVEQSIHEPGMTRNWSPVTGGSGSKSLMRVNELLSDIKFSEVTTTSNDAGSEICQRITYPSYGSGQAVGPMIESSPVACVEVTPAAWSARGNSTVNSDKTYVDSNAEFKHTITFDTESIAAGGNISYEVITTITSNGIEMQYSSGTTMVALGYGSSRIVNSSMTTDASQEGYVICQYITFSPSNSYDANSRSQSSAACTTVEPLRWWLEGSAKIISYNGVPTTTNQYSMQMYIGDKVVIERTLIVKDYNMGIGDSVSIHPNYIPVRESGIGQESPIPNPSIKTPGVSYSSNVFPLTTRGNAGETIYRDTITFESQRGNLGDAGDSICWVLEYEPTSYEKNDKATASTSRHSACIKILDPNATGTAGATSEWWLEGTSYISKDSLEGEWKNSGTIDVKMDEKFGFDHDLIVRNSALFNERVMWSVAQSGGGQSTTPFAGGSDIYSKPVNYNFIDDDLRSSASNLSWGTPKSKNLHVGDTVCQDITFTPPSYLYMIGTGNGYSNTVCAHIIPGDWRIEAKSQVQRNDEGWAQSAYLTPAVNEKYTFNHILTVRDADTHKSIDWKIEERRILHDGTDTTTTKTNGRSSSVIDNNETFVNETFSDYVSDADLGTTICQRILYNPSSVNDSDSINSSTDWVCVYIQYNYDLAPGVTFGGLAPGSDLVFERGSTIDAAGTITVNKRVNRRIGEPAYATRTEQTKWSLTRLIIPKNPSGSNAIDWASHGWSTAGKDRLYTGAIDSVYDFRNCTSDGYLVGGVTSGMCENVFWDLDFTDTDSNVFSPNMTTSLAGTDSFLVRDDFEIGTRICYAVTVYTATDTSDLEFFPKKIRYGTPVCFKAGRRPKVAVLGAGIYAKGLESEDNPSVGFGIITNQSTSGGSTYGSWSEYEAISGQVIQGFGSGSGFYGSVSPWSNLTFANDTPATLGYFSQNTVSNISTKYKNITAPEDPPISTIDLASLLASSDRRIIKRYDSDIIITNIHSVQIPKGTTVMLSINGKATIASNILYTEDPLADIEDIPQLIIMANNIDIDADVTRIDAWLIASSPDDGEGIISTCSGITHIRGDLDDKTCADKLFINGPTVANRYNLYRTYGVEVYDVAEELNLRSDAFLWAYGQSIGDGIIYTTYAQEQAPRY